MSERDALRFIERVAGDLALQSRLREIDATAGLDQVVQIGAEAGFEFDVEQLRGAFLVDWQMRRRFYAAISGSKSDDSKSPPSGSGSSSPS